ncbi:hypothetical protein MM0352_01150 [Helicobacter pylori]
MLYAYLEALGLEYLYTKKNIFTEGKVKNEYKEDYERLKKEAINFESDLLNPLKNFLRQFAENDQKTNPKIF